MHEHNRSVFAIVPVQSCSEQFPVLLLIARQDQEVPFLIFRPKAVAPDKNAISRGTNVEVWISSRPPRRLGLVTGPTIRRRRFLTSAQSRRSPASEAGTISSLSNYASGSYWGAVGSTSRREVPAADHVIEFFV